MYPTQSIERTIYTSRVPNPVIQAFAYSFSHRKVNGFEWTDPGSEYVAASGRQTDSSRDNVIVDRFSGVSQCTRSFKIPLLVVRGAASGHGQLDGHYMRSAERMVLRSYSSAYYVRPNRLGDSPPPSIYSAKQMPVPD